MNIGKLDRRIQLQVATTAANDFGEAVADWQPAGTVWSRIEYKGGSEQTQAGELVALNRVVFTIRYRPGTTARYRVLFEGQTYDIDAVEELGRRAGLRLLSTTRNDALDGR